MSRERAGQIVLCILIIGTIWTGACLPWWEIWAGYNLLILVGLSMALSMLVVGLGRLQDRIDGRITA